MVNSALIGRRTTLSAAAFTGRAVAPGAVAQPDPVTTGLINKNSLQLGVVSNQIQNLSVQVNSLSGSMTVIANNLATSQALERRKEQQELLLERRLAEQQLREGKESAIEQKIQAKTIAPAQKLAGRAQLTLGRLGNFFYTLLGGWLAINALKVIKALSDGNTKELNRLKESIVSNLLKIGSVMLAGKAALALLTLRFRAFGVLATGAAVAGLFSDPIAQFINIVTEALQEGFPGLWKLLSGEAFRKKEDNPATPPTDLGADKNEGTTAGDLNQTEQQEQTEQTEQTDQPEQTQEPEITGIDPTAPPDDLSGTGGPSLIPPSPLSDSLNSISDSVSDSATKFTFDMGSGDIDLTKPVGAEGKTTTIDPETTEMSMTEPVTPMMGREPMSADQLKGNEEEGEAPVNQDIPAEYGEIEMSVNVEPGDVPIEGDPSAGLEPGQMTEDDTTFAQMGTSAAEVQSFIDQEKYIGRTGQLSADMITSMRRNDTVAQTISQSTEPGVTVIPMPIQQAQSQQQAEPIEAPAAQGAVSGVPSIPTSNQDNIYLFGAYSNFNVVPN
jgi:hypothetical protein